MRTNLDFSPLYRSSIGFDRLFNLLDDASRLPAIDTWPPYDIIKIGDDDYQIVMAVAGFAPDELSVTHEPNLLMVGGQKSGEDGAEYLHRGLTGRSFQRRFELADHVSVAGATAVNGLLTIDLKREIPEASKPRRIEIGTDAGAAAASPRQLAPEQQAA
ncbi:MAG: Hsp20 family protein [Devosia sp.]